MYQQAALARLNDKKTEVKHRANEQTAAPNSHQQGNTLDQLSSHVIIETVQYQDYIQQQEHAHYETNQPNQSLHHTSDSPDIDKSSNILDHNVRDSQLNITNVKGPKVKFNETNYGEMIEIELEKDEEECDCDECVYGIEISDDDDDDSNDSVQWIEDDDPELPPPAKKPRIDPTQSHNAQPTAEVQSNQMNNQDKLYITVHLKCPESDCFDTFAEGQLNRHMWKKHSIRSHRCLVKDCAQSFESMHNLRQHNKQVHSGCISQWDCGKCGKPYANYSQLYNHNTKQHQRGQFECSFASCTFTGEYRMQMYTHFYRQHKPALNCPHCNYQTSNSAKLKQHERIHTGIKPYRCKWSACAYASTRKDLVIRHIRRKHFALNPSSVQNGAQLDPKDHVELMRELL